MRFRVLRAYFLKELKEIIRSRTIIMVYLMPSLMTVLFGYGLKMEVKGVKTAVIDYDRGSLSSRLVSKIEQSRYFSLSAYDITEKEALRRLKKAEIELIIIIPEHFERDINKGHQTKLGVYTDATFPSRARTIGGYVDALVMSLLSEMGNLASISPIEINHRNLFNQAMRDEEMVLPGTIGVVLLVAPAVLAALLIVREKEKGTVFNFYCSPVKKLEYIFSKLFAVFMLHSINIFILFFIALVLFKVPFRGSFLLYWLSSELYVLISLSIGLLVSIITRTQIVAIVLTIIITIIPGFLYSGILMPISSMPEDAQFQAHLYPVMYYNQIIYDTFLIGKGLGSPMNRLYLFILIVYALSMLTLGTMLLKKRLR